ncbi:hypothetical protein EB75_26515 [Mycobacterium sp. ST-F2]|nr:hypothetical protein EB75_26515 [Mycobacterium sp. ST-F2]
MVKVGFRSSARFTSGERTRCSTTTNPASTTTATTNAVTVWGDSHPHVGARSKVTVKSPMPVVMRARPPISSRRSAVASELSGMVMAPMSSATADSGTSSKKIARHPGVSVSRPPTNGPAALPSPAMP